jgi:predicted RNA binding protein YcfA (HicA-like mRNA interferase family)
LANSVSIRLAKKGSHVVLKHADGRGCVVPLHRELKIGTLAGILRQARVSTDEFIEGMNS